MIYTYPDYYERFECIADACPDTCCGKWQIVIDEDSLEKYEKYQGTYRQKLHENVDWNESVFRHGGRGTCAFLREDMLCDMYIHMGKDSLCKTCREYPRHTEEFENVREISLSLSCPEVARMLMNNPAKVTFVTKEDDEEEVFEDFDYFLYSNLEDIREKIIAILQDRSLDIDSRFEQVLQIGGSAQRHYDEGDLVFWDEVSEQDKVHENHQYTMLQRQSMFLLKDLELLYSDWEDVLIEEQMLLFSGGADSFAQKKREFDIWWSQRAAESEMLSMDIILEQIAVYFMWVYLLGAVYDDNIIGKVDACIGHAVEIYLLLMARWVKTGDDFRANDLIELVYRYSREIEHSDENLEQVEVLDWFVR